MHIYKSFSCCLLGQVFTIHITHGQPDTPGHAHRFPPVRIDHEAKAIRIRRDDPIESRAHAFFQTLLRIINTALNPANTLAVLIGELFHISATQPDLSAWLGLHIQPHPCTLRNTNEYAVP